MNRQRATAPGLTVTTAAAIGAVFLLLPLAALVAKAPWRQLPDLLGTNGTAQALELSLLTSTIATAVALIVGVPLAVVLARSPRSAPLRALVTVPIVLPPVVGGVALLLAFGRHGLLGPALNEVGIRVPFTTAAVVLAETFVAMPYLVIAVEGALRSTGDRYEAVAATLGADPFTRFRRITVPLIAPAVGTGAALCWGRALGEFGATITFAGDLPGVTETLPVRTYALLQTDPNAAAALGLLLMVIAIVVLLGARLRVR